MPITPFHFGPGAVIQALAPRHVSFLAFCAANVLIDIEPLYYMLTHRERLHRFFHTYVGASLVALAAIALFLVSRRFARQLWLPNPYQWQSLGLLAVAIGAAAGTCSHIVLDSVMHSDIAPFAPFSEANPLIRLYLPARTALVLPWLRGGGPAHPWHPAVCGQSECALTHPDIGSDSPSP